MQRHFWPYRASDLNFLYGFWFTDGVFTLPVIGAKE